MVVSRKVWLTHVSCRLVIHVHVDRDDFVDAALESASTPLRVTVSEIMLPYCLMMFVVRSAILGLSYLPRTYKGTSLNRCTHQLVRG